MDFENAARQLNCEPAALMAIASVETDGNGFLLDGRPTILFEAKTFHRLTNGAFDATYPNLSSPVWDRALYGKSGAHQYDRLIAARLLNDEAALKATSWGAFQIMGENYRLCAFLSVYDFVEAMNKDEDAHLMAFTAFLRSNPTMHTALLQKNWSAFARAYNGPSYMDNQYDSKLAAAYIAAKSPA